MASSAINPQQPARVNYLDIQVNPPADHSWPHV
jgi:hypothetical protein